jgi:hypothetical protein
MKNFNKKIYAINRASLEHIETEIGKTLIGLT